MNITRADEANIQAVSPESILGAGGVSGAGSAANAGLPIRANVTAAATIHTFSRFTRWSPVHSPRRIAPAGMGLGIGVQAAHNKRSAKRHGPRPRPAVRHWRLLTSAFSSGVRECVRRGYSCTKSEQTLPGVRARCMRIVFQTARARAAAESSSDSGKPLTRRRLVILY